MKTNTMGPAFVQELDGARLSTQLETIASLMNFAQQQGVWLTLGEIAERTGYSEASISAQLRHMRKPQWGSNIVEKRRRTGTKGKGGTWEYIVLGTVSTHA